MTGFVSFHVNIFLTIFFAAYTCADVSKAYELLGYRSKVTFDEGIRRTVEWYNTAYQKKEIEVCPELQANGLGRAASIVNLEATEA
jgi:UDP-glucuronate 4-epimerase